MTEHLADRFELVLKLRGWRTASPGHLTKGNWQIIFDTSSWMMLQNASTHIFDVAVPDAYRGPWTANLIEHLARIEDERARLRAALSAIRDHPGAGPSVQSAASAALAECYHTWLGGTPSRAVLDLRSATAAVRRDCSCRVDCHSEVAALGRYSRRRPPIASGPPGPCPGRPIGASPASGRRACGLRPRAPGQSSRGDSGTSRRGYDRCCELGQRLA